MNVTPSDTDVRQGFRLAESVNAQAASPPAAPTAAAATPTPAQTNVSATQTTSTQQPPRADDGDADRSSEVAATADKTTAKETAQKLGSQLASNDTGLKIRVLDDSEHTIQVEIVDEKSKKVLRKIPQDEILKLSASMKEMTGVLLNKPA
jgi:uncharacterized FlaG/YvyC family protein